MFGHSPADPGDAFPGLACARSQADVTPGKVRQALAGP